MREDRQKLSQATDDEVADWKAGMDSLAAADAEFLRRQTLLQREITKAAQESAEAAKDAAKYTKQNACYMLWSVVVLALSSIANVVISLLKHG